MDPLKGSRLLVVDDLADNRFLLAQRLLRKGLAVAEAEDGEQALAALARDDFDLVLLDVTMPGLGGIEVLRRLRADPRLGAVPVVMVTANGASDEIVAALAAGANDYVTKPVDFAVAFARIENILSRKRAEDSLRRLNADLERRVYERTAALVETNVRLSREVRQRRQSEAQVQHLAYHDSLTNLGNRMLLAEKLAVARDTLEPHQSLGLLYLDLDGFKAVNDTFGHGTGDGVLREVASRLRGCVDASTILARLGGDEFVAAKAIASRPEADALAGRIVAALGRPYCVDGHSIALGASIGIAVAPEDGHAVADLLRHADLALYAAKSEGRGGHRHFDPRMSILAQTRRALEADLRRAIANEEFELHYQPLVNLDSNTVSGFEALIRWHRPQRGTVSPADFIPLAEETGLIGAIGEWVLRTACREAAKWPAPTKVAVNISPVQLRTGDLLPIVRDALHASGLAPERLELEVTETVMLHQTERVLENLSRIQGLGVRICMDDFGTGFSSLSHLRSFAFDKIKIDRLFVRDIATRKDCDAIVRAISGLGLSLGVTTTAEGVETVEQLDRVRERGLVEVQGFLFSRPVPAAEVAACLGRIDNVTGVAAA